MNKLIRYRLPVSHHFPTSHPRKGEPTFFIDKIYALQKNDPKFWMKIHTIRENYELWAKRFEKILAGEAVLELYSWQGVPYKSKPFIICQLGKNDGIGIQKLEWWNTSNKFVAYTETTDQDFYSELDDETLSKNDGLSLDDFKAWFKGHDLTKPMVIIHFTKFRY